MPSSMVHLLTAFKYNPKASLAFYVANIAPDSISERNEKDKTHFRDRPDRLKALRELALTMDLKDDFSKGLLLHLFLDYYWDTNPMRNFIENYKEGDWFPAYRHEIALTGGWLYHNTGWGKKIWDEMAEISTWEFENAKGLVADVDGFINRNRKWHAENNIGPSSVFTPDFIEVFTDKVTLDFKVWLEDLTSNT